MVTNSLRATQSHLVFCQIKAINPIGRTTTVLHRRRHLPLGSAIRGLNYSICALSEATASRWHGPPCPGTQPALKRKILLRAVTANSWDQTTSSCVQLSTIAFIFLLMPQVIKNHLSASSGNSEALAVLSWVVSEAQTSCKFVDLTTKRVPVSFAVGLPDIPFW